MRFLLHNILDGGEPPERFDRLCTWWASGRWDVIAICEANGWRDTARQQAVRERTGLPHLVVLDPGPSAYAPALLSSLPITVIEQHRDGFAHGLLVARTHDIVFAVSHWHPKDPEARVREATVCAHVVTRASTPALLVGDLNSHSPVDDAWLRAEGIAAWAADYRAHQVLLDAGLVDLVDDASPRHSTATALNPREPRRRIDHWYANQAFHQRFPKATAHVCIDRATQDCSDHFPVSLTEPDQTD